MKGFWRKFKSWSLPTKLGLFLSLLSLVWGGGLVINNNNYFVDQKVSRNYYKDFPKDIKGILENNKDKLIKIFSESDDKEAGDYACSINLGLHALGFKVRGWPDSISGFDSTTCIQYNSLILDDLEDFKSVGDKPAIKVSNGIRIIDINSDRVILWVGKNN